MIDSRPRLKKALDCAHERKKNVVRLQLSQKSPSIFSIDLVSNPNFNPKYNQILNDCPLLGNSDPVL